jgi:hypothetical protein
MKAMEIDARWKQAAGAAIGMSALAFTVACNGTPTLAGVAAQQLPAPQAAAPVVVSCEPHQRTLVRQATVNGAPVSQVECIAAGSVAMAVPAPSVAPAQPVAYAPAAAVSAPAKRALQPVSSELPDAQVVPSSGSARPVRTRQVVYDEPVRRTRSATKSAVIIGSSAGVGAGVGAAMGGKKGALIGAAIGGGGAAIWDQVTRRK